MSIKNNVFKVMRGGRCRWKIENETGDLPPEVWDFIKKNRFFGMIIPKQYDGLEFSARAQSDVIIKIASRSVAAAVTVMVPNSLGPGELLLHYGTREQKDFFLPRLAREEEIPAFALTGPMAGSDAGAMPDVGVVCRGTYQGQETLGFRVNWSKRYITLGPICSLLGLAFKAQDPEGLLGGEADLGITCALIPADTPGVTIGERHDPGAAFQNGPNSGKDVFVPMEWVIGGQQQVGQGWKMLMDCLSVGRAISLPALGAAAGKACALTTGAYSRIRRQFRTPIGRFEGIEEALARIGGITYRMEAGRLMTAGVLAQGQKPSVLSAILKYNNTEGMRTVVNAAMDVHAGKAVCRGPANYLNSSYQTVPVAITVEGANILTRSMIVFGQGAIRCHPYVLQEMLAAADPDKSRGLADFDEAAAAFREVLSKQPNPRAFSNVAWIYYHQGKFKDAVQMSREAIALSPGDYRLVGNLGDALKQIPGRLQEAQDEYRQAAEMAEALLAVNPADVDALSSLGHFYAQLGQVEKARTFAEAAVEAAPDDVYAHYYAALVWLANVNTSNAIDAIKAATELGYSTVLLKADPQFEALAEDPRFMSLLKTTK